ncbi:MAG: penicillin acylase family protein [Gemmatimonadota bacterium]
MSVSRNVSATLAALILSGGIVTTGGYFFLQRSVQPRSGVLDLPGLDAVVDVSYDRWAIPTIVARRERDLFRAQGFIHASERLWQLELFQRIAKGRLAEIFGESAVATDRLIRTLDLWGASTAELETLSPEDRRLLEAYAEGVNARIRSWRGPLPPEFLILGIRPQPWSPTASLGIARIMSLDLSGWRGELDRVSTLARIPRSLHEELDVGYPDWGPTIMQDSVAGGLALSSGGMAESAALPHAPVVSGVPALSGVGAPPEPPDMWDPVETLSSYSLRASNSWAIGATRTGSGHPLLANDMHLALRAPSTWFVNGLHAADDGVHVAGLSIPGAPGVIVGLNRHVAWGFTNAMVDDGDFVVEAVNLDASMYRHDGGWRTFGTRVETIAVRGGDPVEHIVRRTVRGPVITDVLPAAGLTLSLLWTGLEPRGAVGALFEMNRARTADEFLAAAESFQSPHQNVIYATTEDELGYRLVGSIPVRDGAVAWSPISFEALPDGWSGFVPPGDMPSFRSPPTDYVASANNLQARDLFGVVGVRYPLPFRARRIVDRVSRASAWTVEDMVDLQLDTYSLWAERLVPRAAAAARRIGRSEVAEQLEAWDRRVTVDSREAVWFYVWLYRLRERIAADELDGAGYFPDRALDLILSRGASRWVDDTRTEEVETLEALEEEAMRTAIDVAGERRWGELHSERSVHPLGQVAILDRLLRFHIKPYPAPGGRHTVRPTDPGLWSGLDSTSWQPPFVGEYGPSERFVADMNPAHPVGHFFLPTGQAGNPLDPHYRSMVSGWLAGEMVEVSLDPADYLVDAKDQLRLSPASGRN